MNKSTEPSISQKAWALYSQQAKRVFPTSFNFTMILIVVLALAMWIPESLYISIPFLVVPFFFAYQMAVSYLRKGTDITNRQFFAYYGAYFGMPFTGCYRVIRNALLSFLWAMLASFAVAIFYYAIGSAVSSSFKDSLAQLSTLIQENSITEINDFLSKNTDMVYFYNAISLSESFVLFYSFFHYLASYGLNPYLRSVIVGASPRVCNAIYVGGLRMVRGAFLKDYYSSLWLGVLLLAFGYAGGAGLALLFTGSSGVIGVCGIAGAALLISFYIPYYFNVVSLLADKYHNSFADYSIKMAQLTLDELQKAQKLSEQETADLEKTIDSAKKVKDEGKNEDGKDGPGDDGGK